jgi:hypothetical protein
VPVVGLAHGHAAVYGRDAYTRPIEHRSMTSHMIYIKKLRRGTLHRTVTIALGTESNPGYLVFTEDIETKGIVVSGPAPGVKTPHWFCTKEDAFAFAERAVQSSRAEGFVLSESETLTGQTLRH